jgi:hypothetical protein
LTVAGERKFLESTGRLWRRRCAREETCGVPKDGKQWKEVGSREVVGKEEER